MENPKKIAVFGIFDGVHEGHRDFFRQALQTATGQAKTELIVLVGRDSTAEKLKHKKPQFSEKERLTMLLKEPLVSNAVLGDKTLSIYAVLKKINPDIVCLGYDQQELGNDLARWIKKNHLPMKIFFLKPYKSHLFHSSKINKKTSSA